MDHLILVSGYTSDGELWSAVVPALNSVARCSIGDTFQGATLADMAWRILEIAPPRFASAGFSISGKVALQIKTLALERVSRQAMVDTTTRSAQRRRNLNAAWPTQ